MAYVSKETKALLVTEVKTAVQKVISKTGDDLKMTFSVRNHSEIVCTIQSGTIDFGVDHQQVNHYWIDTHFKGIAADVLKAIASGLKSNGYYNNSDLMNDYFDHSWYISINIGKWNKQYQLIKKD